MAKKIEPVGNPIKIGRYKHFKGNEYKVLHCGRHSEDLSIVVVYQSLVDNEVWVRPLSEWNKPLPSGGERFKFIPEVERECNSWRSGQWLQQ